jgi:hypothetical protein
MDNAPESDIAAIKYAMGMTPSLTLPGNEYDGEFQGVGQNSAVCACAYRCNITPI